MPNQVQNQFPTSKPVLQVGAGTVVAPDKKEFVSVEFLTDTVITSATRKDGTDAFNTSGDPISARTWLEGTIEYFRYTKMIIASGEVICQPND